VDERFVIVNIGYESRRELAQQLRLISQYKPRVIAIDAFFNCEGGLRDTVDCPALLDTLGNLMLASAIEEAGNVVLAEKLLQTNSMAQVDSNTADSIEHSDPLYRVNVTEGFVTIPTDATYQQDVKMCRSIWPSVKVNGSRELAFSTQIAMQYDSAKAMEYLNRNLEEELVNFRGNIEVLQLRVTSLKNNETGTSNYATYFYTVDVGQLERGEVLGDVFRNSIVIMGFLGGRIGEPTWEDKFFTPLNKKVAGRANPDMFGVVVHANIVAMILNGDYINQWPTWLLSVIAFVVCCLTVILLIVIDHKLPTWFDALSFFVQLIIILIISFLAIKAFETFSLKLDLSLTLAVTALVGPCYDIFKSFQNEFKKRFTKPRIQGLKNT
jgi:CHASE2 domain-containing sensor protein